MWKLTIEDQTETVKRLRKYNTGRGENRIHFANVQVPYKLLGTDLEEVGEEENSRTDKSDDVEMNVSTAHLLPKPQLRNITLHNESGAWDIFR